MKLCCRALFASIPIAVLAVFAGSSVVATASPAVQKVEFTTSTFDYNPCNGQGVSTNGGGPAETIPTGPNDTYAFVTLISTESGDGYTDVVNLAREAPMSSTSYPVSGSIVYSNPNPKLDFHVYVTGTMYVNAQDVPYRVIYTGIGSGCGQP